MKESEKCRICKQRVCVPIDVEGEPFRAKKNLETGKVVFFKGEIEDCPLAYYIMRKEEEADEPDFNKDLENINEDPIAIGD